MKSSLEILVEQYQEGLITEGDLLLGVAAQIEHKISPAESDAFMGGLRLILDRECVQGDKLTERSEDERSRIFGPTYLRLTPLACL